MFRSEIKLSRGFLAAFGLIGTLAFSACGPGFKASDSMLDSQHNMTGFTTPDGRQHTGASGDQALPEVKTEIAGSATTDVTELRSADRALAIRLFSAGLVGAKESVRVYVYIRDAGKLLFEFNPSDVAPKAATDRAGDTRYKAVVAKNDSGDTVPFEASLLCRPHKPEGDKPAREGCRAATLVIHELHGNDGKAGLIIRSQETSVLAKTPVAVKHETLKRLADVYKVPRVGSLQSFEVAWGPSGFALNIGDTEVCPVGRLVETNDLDEPLKLNCPGTPEIHDLEGRMIGNTTRGEVFLEIGTPGKVSGELTERIFLIVRQKRAPKTPATGTTPSNPTQTPPSNTTPQDPDDVAEDEDMEPLFQDETRPIVDAQPSVRPVPTNSKSWIMNIDFNHPITRKWAADRKDPAIDRGIKKWLKDSRLKEFAVHFIPNRDLVTRELAKSNIPAEFAFITLKESAFFITDGYPVQTPGKKSTALGPWQFLNDTATGNGLRILPKNKVGGKVVGHACDERADLAKSSAAAGRYLRSISDMFPYDPKLVVLGYNQGEYGVKKKIEKLQGSRARLAVVKELGLNFWAIRRFNMVPMGAINYVQDFVSIYHAALELKQDEVPMRKIAPWRPNPKCK